MRTLKRRSVLLSAGKAAVTLAASVLALGGCKRPPELMPLELGRTWTYVVRVPERFNTYISPLRVEREVSVANVQGVELTSTLGPARMAWMDDALVTERLAETQFRPPLPLLFNKEETSERKWKGDVIFVDRESPAFATQSQKPDDDIDYGGRKIRCIRSTVSLKTAAHRIELITWFAPGLGIVQQEQRTDDRLIVRLEQLPPNH